MASIGLYGVYYSKCVKENGVTTAYDGSVKQMGKAISASFEPNVPEDNPLYANNGIVENDISAGNGGELTMTLDRMTLETHADLYGTTVSDVSVTVDGQTVAGKEIVYKGSEVSSPIGVAYIKLQQEDGVRHHDVLFYREVAMTRPGDEGTTMGESIEWQTPEITATVAGAQGDGTQPWFRMARFPNQEAAIAYVYQLFGGVSV
jgi:hypothetical protein